ncbi:MerR family transcriptional regulator [Actinocrinis puniceicyclus]|uniref:MerR family transcriptional regulator n=1 Tax=Actinocrinis puniceicyclus TaxID=977794 RepID=A0A8J7WNM2_9ACTN|nr:MerR family transcriptional regulator [Actinocrinis puniceicyclus]MBS2963017.1 MerR family transcriptional regulator [Actinocrinis puniceicyclus]
MAGVRGSANGSAAGTRVGRGAPHGRAPRRTLTIGEAAARLSADYPGVTAAVLRRLEAAGKFTPARSSTGYRRYSEADLDLIRLVLSQQPGARPAAADPADLSGAESALAHPAAGQSAAADELAGAATHHHAAARVAGRAARAPGSRVPAARPAPEEGLRPAAIDPLFDIPVTGHGPRAAAFPHTARRDAPAREAARQPGAGAPPAEDAAASAPGPASSSRRADRRWPDAEFFAPDLGEVALDLDQLAAAARTDRAWVDGLVEYGLLSGGRPAGGADLLVARAAAELAQFGVEPRHLRAVAASAGRVAELIATATASGREAGRRERALPTTSGRSAEAAAAAVRLHAALVRAALLRG